MANVNRIRLGQEAHALEQRRSAHGRWRWGFQSATPSEDEVAVPSALVVYYDVERLAFALTDGPAADFLAEQIADYLWSREALGDKWPLNLREWLADTSRWEGAPSGKTAFICGRLERHIPGGRIYLAWLGLNGVRLQDRAGEDMSLDTALSEDEGWSAEHGPEPEGMALHAYRGSLFRLGRLIVLSGGAAPLFDDLPDMSQADLQQALEDWAEEATHDLAFLDLRINPVLSEPHQVALHYRWVAPELCMLFWSPAPNATAYRIEESATPTFEQAALVAELTDGRQTQYRLSPPTDAPRYYRVVPLNQGVVGTPSEPVLPVPVVLTAPLLQRVKWADDGGYVLSWTPIVQATSYEVQVAESPEFEPFESEIIYRGEVAELYLPPDTPPHRYYRVRAINVLYAPHNPSPWSRPQRAPERLATPHFTRVTHEQLEWEPVRGAQLYEVRVTALSDEPEIGEEERTETVRTSDTLIGAAEQPATYRVRALRHPDDRETVSAWSDTVTLASQEVGRAQGRHGWLWYSLFVAALVGALVGVGLGVSGLRRYQLANATATRTPYPSEAVVQTKRAATAYVMHATAASRLSTEVRLTEVAFVAATGTAGAWTETPTPTLTWTPSNTPNATETLAAAFAAGLTATASQWTETPTPTLTRTPSPTPNMTATFEAAFVAGLTATAEAWTATPTATPTPNVPATAQMLAASALTETAAAWTDTPTPSATPNVDATFRAAFVAGLTATAELWTETPMPTLTHTPTRTPNVPATAQMLAASALTATAHAWTETPMPSATPNVDATIAAYMAVGCYVVSPEMMDWPVYTIPLEGASTLAEGVPVLAQVLERRALLDPDQETVEWLLVGVWRDGRLEYGWVRVPSDVDVAELYDGPQCP